MSTQPQPFIPVGDLHPASWHQDRAKGVGGSECASLFNEGYGCHNRLVREKRGQEPDYRLTAAQEKIMQRGTMMEDIVAQVFTMETGLKIRKQPSRTSKTHPHARVNMDRQIVAVDGKTLYELTKDAEGRTVLEAILANPGPGVLECKTMNPWDFKKVQREGLTKHNHYILQVQHGLAVTGYKWGAFAIWETTSGDSLWFPMLRNEPLCAEILSRTEETWELVEDATKPLPAPLPDGDRRCNNCLWRRSCRGDEYLTKHAEADFSSDYTDTADPQVIQWATDLTDAEADFDQAKEIVDTIKGLLRTHMTNTGVSKLRVPELRRFCLSSTPGRKGWDGKAIEGEINALRKGETPGLTPGLVVSNETAAIIASVTTAIAERIANCQKTGAPSSSFRTYNA